MYRIMREKVINFSGEKFIYGELVKYKQLLEGEIVDEESDRIIESGLPKGVVAISKFFIHSKTMVVGYRPIKSRISEQQFKVFLAKLIAIGHENFFVDVEIDSVDEDVKIEDSLSIFQRIQRIITNVRPTNPSNRPVYRTLDERLRRLNATGEYRDLRASESGLNKDALAEDEAFMGVMLASDGYGKASIEGVAQNGKRLVVRTEDSPVTRRVTDSESPEDIIGQLFRAFEDIWERKRNA